VPAVSVGYLAAQRTVGIYRGDGGEQTTALPPPDGEQDLLGPVHAEGGNQDAPSGRKGLPYLPDKEFLLAFRITPAGPISGLDDDEISFSNHFRLPEKGDAPIPHVAGKDDLTHFSSGTRPDLDHRRTEDMPRIPETDGYIPGKLAPATIGKRFIVPQHRLYVFRAIH